MSTDYTLGQVIFSTSGRDKGRPFVVVSIEDEYLHVVDGMLRKIERPKLKKVKHIQKTNTTIEWIKQKIIEETLTNADVKRALKEYLEKASGYRGGL